MAMPTEPPRLRIKLKIPEPAGVFALLKVVKARVNSKPIVHGVGRVEMWRSGGRRGLSVSVPFV